MSQARILIVEDEAIIAKDIENTLKGLGYAVAAITSSGQEAIEKAMEARPDLVLMDIVLRGGIDGIEAARQIYTRLHIPVIFVTAHLDEITLDRAKITEPFGYLIKPFQERELRSTIEIALYKHQMERKLKESRQWFVTMLRSISDAVIATDKDGTVEFMNSMAEVLTGWKEEVGVGRPLQEVFQLTQDGRGGTAEDPVMKMALEGTTVGFGNERILISKDGKEIRIDHSAAPLRDESEGIKGFILTFHDITERKILEGQLVQAQKLKAVGQLAAGIAHEINTPTQYVGDNTLFLKEAFTGIHRLLGKYEQLLKAIKAGAMTDGLIQDIEATVREIELSYLTEEIPKAIEQTLEGVERVAKIVRAMKEFSHPGAVEKTPIDINKAIETTVTVARNEWKYVAEMMTDFDPSLPLVPCLPGEFNQVILNLIINAAHAIAPVVGHGSGGKGIIRVSTRSHNDCVEIRISDTGTGIPKDIQSRVFEPFFTTKKVGKGTGQGLAIAHSVIVGKHGGTITFDSEIGKGTTFLIRLPMQENHRNEKNPLCR